MPTAPLNNHNHGPEKSTEHTRGFDHAGENFKSFGRSVDNDVIFHHSMAHSKLIKLAKA
jgi:hypothetical protein